MALVVVSVLVGAFIFLRFRKLNKPKRIGAVLAAGLGAVLLLASVNYWFDGALADRLLSTLDLNKGTGGLRLEIWSLTMEMVKEQPWIGTGLGDWKIEFQEFGLAKQELFIAEPLNDYVGILSESGIGGCISYVLMLLVSVGILVRSILKSATEDAKFKIAVLSSLLAFIVISSFNFPLHRIEHMCLVLFALAFAENAVGKSVLLKSNIVKPLVIFIVMPALLYIGYVGYTRFQSERHTKIALEQRAMKNWQAVEKSIGEVNLTYYPIEPSTTPVIWYKGIARFQQGKTNEALQDFEAAYKVNPYHIHVINNMATCYALQGNIDRAIDLYKHAIERNDRFPDAVENLLAIYMHLEEYDKAYELINTTPLTDNGPGNIESRLQRARKRLVRSGKVNVEQ